jgi:hypothetical protein
LIPIRVELEEMTKKESPDISAERRIILRWDNLEETNPERNIVMLYPMDIKRNKLPACAWLRFMSLSIVKSKGEKISRERKLKNTIPAKKKIGVMLEKKSFCSGLAIIF